MIFIEKRKRRKEKKSRQICAIWKGKKRILPISQGGENFVSIRSTSTALETNKPEKLQNSFPHPRGVSLPTCAPCFHKNPWRKKTGHAISRGHHHSANEIINLERMKNRGARKISSFLFFLQPFLRLLKIDLNLHSTKMDVHLYHSSSSCNGTRFPVFYILFSKSFGRITLIRVGCWWRILKHFGLIIPPTRDNVSTFWPLLVAF